MSFYRFIYFCALIVGWCAFVGWLVAECMPLPESSRGTSLHDSVIAAFVGAGIGAGLSVLSRTGTGPWYLRLLSGLVGGLIGGAVGGFMGDVLFSFVGLHRSIGWMIMGLCIGSIEGIYEKSLIKLRNGLIGGGLGGLIGGLLFKPVHDLVASGTGLTSRATAFVVLGLAIGCLMGFVQIIFREAWLTVLDGFRPGRQVILSQADTILGRGEWVSLPFMGTFGSALEMEHLRVVRQADGRYGAEDKNTKTGSQINNQRLQGTVVLTDGDVIRIGNNIIRFNERIKHESPDLGQRELQPAVNQRPVTQSPATLLPPPPPPPKPGFATAPLATVVPMNPLQPPPPPPKPKLPTASPNAPTIYPAKPSIAPPPATLVKPQIATVPPPPPALTKPNIAAPVQPTKPPPVGGDDLCPICKRKVPGIKGSRYCMVDDITF